MTNPCIQLRRPDPSSVLCKVCWELENKPSLTEVKTSPQFLHFTLFGRVTCCCHAIPVSLDLNIGLRYQSVQQKRPSQGLSFHTVIERLQNTVTSQQLRIQQLRRSANPGMDKYFGKRILSKMIVMLLLNYVTR